jgi:hypothetical protein
VCVFQICRGMYCLHLQSDRTGFGWMMNWIIQEGFQETFLYNRHTSHFPTLQDWPEPNKATLKGKARSYQTPEPTRDRHLTPILNIRKFTDSTSGLNPFSFLPFFLVDFFFECRVGHYYEKTVQENIRQRWGHSCTWLVVSYRRFGTAYWPHLQGSSSSHLVARVRFSFIPPLEPRPPQVVVLLIIFRHTTVGRTPLDEGSARSRDLYLTTHNTHNRQTSMPPAGFEPAIPASDRQQAFNYTSLLLGSANFY